MKIQYYYDILDSETDEKERQKLLDEVRYWKKYCQDNDCVVFDLSVEYGCDDVLDSLEQKLKGFSVLKSLDEWYGGFQIMYDDIFEILEQLTLEEVESPEFDDIYEKVEKEYGKISDC